MDLVIKLLRQVEDPALDRAERARLRCRAAKGLEDSANYEAAREAMGELWRRVGERPNVDGLDPGTTAEVLLRAGALTGWIGSTKQVDGAQETAKDLISESAAIFESLGETEKLAESYIDLAICYWREGALDEARVTLQEVLGRLAGPESEQRPRALLNSAVIEIAATRFNDALRLLAEAAPLFDATNSHPSKGRFHSAYATVLKKLATAEGRKDYIDRALLEYSAASYHFEQAGRTFHKAATENNIGFLLFTAGRFNEAYEHLDRAHLLFASLKDSVHMGQVDDTRARILLAQKRNTEAEKVARSGVRTLEKGEEPSVLAEALTTHGVALARLGRYEEARFTLERAAEMAAHAGDNESAGVAGLTLIEELGERIPVEELIALYERSDQSLVGSQNFEILARLRTCARKVLEAGRARVRESAPPKFVYADKQTAELLRSAHTVAATGSPVLITGETGTGKELLARMIHEWSGRAGQFVAVNCAALGGALIESLLFGHRKGSFTDAVQDSIGVVRHAAGGTLFLDEIAELSLADQGKLLRLIENGEAHAIGAPEPERVNVRIIASTNRELEELVAEKRFRDDLLYRLNAFHLDIPPLRKRPDDIAALAEHFSKELAEQHNRHVRLRPEAVEAMRSLELNGNVRELRSLVERSILTATHGADITRDSVELLAARQTKQASSGDAWAGCSLEDEVLRYEASLIKLAFENSRGSVTRAARLLGVSHQRLCSMLQGRHRDLLPVKKPAQPRRRSIIKS
ncbi:MAG TPA: sigma 54-interacting transcriptional regulator [Pyrinomonadaceae bacterium]|nr:sigma 54-interacting transcriptional regulator [Pyrinomonadaceae bacterium]